MAHSRADTAIRTVTCNSTSAIGGVPKCDSNIYSIDAWYAGSLQEGRCRWHFSSPQSPFPRARAKKRSAIGGVPEKRRQHPKKRMLGTPEGTRTPHLLLRRQLLYPDELLARIGASDGNRTHAHSLEGCCTSRYTTPALSRSASAIKFYHMVSRMSRIISRFCPNSSAIFAKVLRKVFANGFTARGWAVARGRRERESYGWKMECLHRGIIPARGTPHP